MFFDNGIVLRDADEGLGDVDAGVAEQRLCEGQCETACIGGIE